MSPCEDGFVTCSDDGTLRKWNNKTRKMTAMVETKFDKDEKRIDDDKKFKGLFD